MTVALIASAALGMGLLGGCSSSCKTRTIECGTEPIQCETAPMGMAEPLAGYDDVKNVSRMGGLTFAGQPTEAALARYAAEGGTMVIDLRTHQGSDGANFDEAATVAELGMAYVHIPMSAATMSTEDVKRFAEALREAKGPVMVHCGSSNRVGGLWAAFVALEKGCPTEKAIEKGKAAGMRSASVEEAARRVIAEGGE